MKISIITITYNSEKTLTDTLESVLAQTYQEIEYIVVDGASKDGTMELVKKYESRFEGRMRYISEPDNGLYDAMNKGMRMATGEVVGILNSDDYYTDNGVLQRVAEEFRKGNVDAVYGDVHYVHPDDLKHSVRYYSSKPFRRWMMRIGFMPAHPSFYCRREIYQKYGTFNTSYKVAADFENLLRLVFVNRIRTRYIPMDFVTMRTGGASSSGLSSHKQIMHDHLRALKENGVYSNIFLLGLRYLYKIGEVLKSRMGIWWLLGFLLVSLKSQAQPMARVGEVDIFMGMDFNYRDIFGSKPYEFLINLTPGVKWNLGKQWQVAAQVLLPVYNDYGDYYKRVRLNMAVLSKEWYFGEKVFLKGSGGLFSYERYGLDAKLFYTVNPWLALEAQAGWTGFCSMATGWTASTPERWTALAGADVYLHRWNTQLRVRGGRFIYEDYGVIAEGMRHFTHCSVGLYVQYSDEAAWNGGFKVVMMIPPYRRKYRKVNIRPASNFRLTYNIQADPYANKMYNTDPEENEREGWFDRERLLWGSNTMTPDFRTKEGSR